MISLGAGHHPCPPSLWPKRYSCPTFHVNRSVIHRKHTYIYVYIYIYILFSKPACAAPVKKKTNSTSIISLLFFPHPSIRPHKKALEGGFGARIIRYNAPSESFLLLQKSAISNPSLLDESGRERERGDSPTHARSPGRDWPGELQPLKSRYIILCLASA